MTMSACPACDAAPLAQSLAATSLGQSDLILSLPDIHCAGCIGGVERAMLALPGVASVRVNLSRKRVVIAAPEVSADTAIAALAAAGHAAQELDGTLLESADSDVKGRALLLRLAVAGFGMMNVMLFSVAVWSGAAQATQVMFHWISAAIAVPALAFSAQVFFSHAWKALRDPFRGSRFQGRERSGAVGDAIVVHSGMRVPVRCRHGRPPRSGSVVPNG